MGKLEIYHLNHASNNRLRWFIGEWSETWGSHTCDLFFEILIFFYFHVGIRVRSKIYKKKYFVLSNIIAFVDTNLEFTLIVKYNHHTLRSLSNNTENQNNDILFMKLCQKYTLCKIFKNSILGLVYSKHVTSSVFNVMTLHPYTIVSAILPGAGDIWRSMRLGDESEGKQTLVPRCSLIQSRSAFILFNKHILLVSFVKPIYSINRIKQEEDQPQLIVYCVLLFVNVSFQI